jgi:hypothetical protein
MTVRRGQAAAAAVAILLAGLAGGFGLHAADTASASRAPGGRPILLELFTSEGCSSCPTVDVWAERLDRLQPIQGAEIIVLSEHVNYWDQDGWKDPFSSEQLTARQFGYEQTMGIGSAYTPQVILNGDQELKVQNSNAQIRETFEKAAMQPMLPVNLASVTVGAGALTGRVAVDATSDKRGGDVFVAVALDRTQTDVLAGENGGKKLTNIGVVKDLVQVGKLEKGKKFEESFTVKLWPGADAGNLRVVAFVQSKDLGKVMGAAMTKEIGKGTTDAQVSSDAPMMSRK